MVPHAACHLPVAKALTRRGKLAQLMPYHFLGDGDGKMELAIVYEEFESGVNALLKTYPTKFGRNMATPKT